jgi:predicted dehydrogenase
MKFLVVGCGSIGERHIKNLKSISAGQIIVSDINSKRLNNIKKKYRLLGFNDYQKALDQQPDAVLVCSPPSSHIPISIDAVKNNAHLFIEKPLSNTMNKVDELLQCAKRRKLIVFVGYNFRFQKGIQLVKEIMDRGTIGKIMAARAEYGQYLPDWRPLQDYTKSYSAKLNLGGGIILDGSHEIDYMRWFFGEIHSLFCCANKVSDLDVETEDIAEILIYFKKGILCEIHIDFIRPGYTRNCEIIGKKGVITWDFLDRNVKIYDILKKRWKSIKTPCEINDMYIEEMKHFIYAVNGLEKPLIDGDEGKKTLQVALFAKKSAKSQKLVKL